MYKVVDWAQEYADTEDNKPKELRFNPVSGFTLYGENGVWPNQPPYGRTAKYFQILIADFEGLVVGVLDKGKLIYCRVSDFETFPEVGQLYTVSDAETPEFISAKYGNDSSVIAALLNIKRGSRNADDPFYESFEELVRYLASTYSDKYETVKNGDRVKPQFNLRLGLGFNLGNAYKYLARYASPQAGTEDGKKKLYNPLDLFKAVHYLLFEHSRRSLEKQASKK